MRIWVYGNSPEQIQSMIEEHVSANDTVAGTSVLVRPDSTFPQNGLTPAMSAAIRGEFDLLLIPALKLLGNKTKAEQMIELFQGYGISVRSLSSNGISSS